MEEFQVTVDGMPRPLPDPFVVAATQNPVEYEGTYPLPEAQLDRFLLKLVLPLPPRDDEIAMLTRHARASTRVTWPRPASRRSRAPPTSRPGGPRSRRVAARPEVLAYVVDMCRATRRRLGCARGLAARGDGAAARRARLGVALGS